MPILRHRRYNRLYEQVLLSHSFSLFLGWMFTVGIPSLLYWGPEALLNANEGQRWGMAASTAALLLSHVSVHRLLATYPGGRSMGMVVPNVIAIYLLFAVTVLSLYVGVSRFLLAVSGISALVWFQIEYIVSYRFRRPKLAIVPSGQAVDLLALTEIDARPLLIPDLENKRYDGVVADFECVSDEWERFLARCALERTPVYNARTVYESVTGRVRINRMSENELGSLLPSPVYTTLKTLMDWSLVIGSTPVTIPLMLITMVCIKLESPGPVIYTQTRMGQGNKPFTMYKLRSMRHEKSSEEQFAEENDPRVTRVGRFIRRFRIDELPQFINVLKGQMSLVGPRPEQPRFVEQFDQQLPFYIYRHVVKPGITGWAQVRQGYAADVDATREKMEHDFYYIKHCSLFLDAFIVLLTVKTLFTGHGSR